MLSRSGYYSWWAARFVVAIGLGLLAVDAHAKYFPRVPWVAVEFPLLVVIIMTILRGPMSYAAYVRAGAKRTPARTE